MTMDANAGHIELTLDAGPGGEGARLDKFLSTATEIGSRAEAQRLIGAGMVLVDGRERSKNYRLKGGEKVEVRIPPPELSGLQPEEMDLSIPYEDEYLLVVDKPAGIVTHPAKGHDTGTLVHGLLGHQAGGGEHPQRPGIVHRLDKDTSGLLVVAKDHKTHRMLVDMLSRHEIARVYTALVHGLFETREGTVEAPLGRDALKRQQMAVSPRGGRQAVTHFKVIDSWSGASAVKAGKKAAAEGFTLLQVRLETGRTHQIRVHLAAIGHPIAGDSVYGRRRDVLGVGRQFLHSARLSFKHPVTGKAVEVESPLPADLKAALELLR